MGCIIRQPVFIGPREQLSNRLAVLKHVLWAAVVVDQRERPSMPTTSYDVEISLASSIGGQEPPSPFDAECGLGEKACRAEH